MFEKLIDYYTRDFGCLIIDNFNKYDNVLDRVKFIKATNLDKQNFIIGNVK